MSARFGFEENHFRETGPESPSVVSGIVGKALRFNGKNQFAEIRGPGVAVGESNFSIELWARTGLTTGVRNIVDRRSRTPFGYAIYLYRGRPGMQVANGSHNNLSAPGSIADNRWHHIAAVFQRLPPDVGRLYVDGTQVAVGESHVPLNNLDVPEPLWLGRHHPNERVQSDYFFEGEMDELAFYKRAITAKEIRAIYQAGAKGKCKTKSP